MLNKNGGIAADLTVSTLDTGNNSSAIFPEFRGTNFHIVFFYDKLNTIVINLTYSSSAAVYSMVVILMPPHF